MGSSELQYGFHCLLIGLGLTVYAGQITSHSLTARSLHAKRGTLFSLPRISYSYHFKATSVLYRAVLIAKGITLEVRVLLQYHPPTGDSILYAGVCPQYPSRV